MEGRFSYRSPHATSLLRPYYVVMRLPGSSTEEFVLILPFTPVGRNNMVAWMAAESDPTDYGHVVSYEFTIHRTEPISGLLGAMYGFSDEFPDKQFLIIPQDPK